MTISKTLHLSLAKADIHIPVDTEPDMLGRVIEAAERQRTETKRRVRLGLPIGNVRLSEWERVTLKRGPNKGKTAWKKGNRYFHGEKPPEGRGGKQEAGTKGKSVPKPKADKVTPQAMVEKHKAIMAKGPTSHDDMQGFINDLLTMTVKDINEVKKSLGLKASGKKAELAKKIGQKAFELVGKGKGKAEVEQGESEQKPLAIGESTRGVSEEDIIASIQVPSHVITLKPGETVTRSDGAKYTNKSGKRKYAVANADNQIITGKKTMQIYDAKHGAETNLRVGQKLAQKKIHDTLSQHREQQKNNDVETLRSQRSSVQDDVKKAQLESDITATQRGYQNINKPTSNDYFNQKVQPANKPTEKNIDTMSPGELYKYAKELGITPGKSKPQNMKLIKEHLGKNEGQ